MRLEIFICFMAMGLIMATADSVDHELPGEKEVLGVLFPSNQILESSFSIIELMITYRRRSNRYYHHPTTSTSPRGPDGGLVGGPRQITLDMPPLTGMPHLTAMRPLHTLPSELRIPWRDQRQRSVEPSTTSGSETVASSAASNNI
ncbi:hypothetical protein C5167_018165 [Papaver somniferum]|uniref:Uncharacterized protein n=1 Tax=Papaver somniferum TaxID=3469 RepID=A0A4Y7IPU4_PAPSO|nr:hypothetical protein C5167_018165 [Papaver somniferum]